MKKLSIWDNQNKQWLELISIYFGNGVIWKITACKINENPLDDGWYDLMGDALNLISIPELGFNTHLLPSDYKNEEKEFWMNEFIPIFNDIMNLGMKLRQDQLNGSDMRSGNDVLAEYLDNLKK